MNCSTKNIYSHEFIAFHIDIIIVIVSIIYLLFLHLYLKCKYYTQVLLELCSCLLILKNFVFFIIGSYDWRWINLCLKHQIFTIFYILFIMFYMINLIFLTFFFSEYSLIARLIFWFIGIYQNKKIKIKTN